MFDKYVNNRFYELQVTLSPKFYRTEIIKEFKGNYKKIENQAEMDVNVEIFSKTLGGTIESYNARYNYMTIQQFKKYFFGNGKLKNVKIYRSK